MLVVDDVVSLERIYYAFNIVRRPKTTIVPLNPYFNSCSGMDRPSFPPTNPPVNAPRARAGAIRKATVPLDMWVAVPTIAVGTIAVKYYYFSKKFREQTPSGMEIRKQ